MPRHLPTMLSCLAFACGLTACAKDPQIRTIQLPPVIEKQRLARELVTPCRFAGSVPASIEPATAHNAARVGAAIAAERDCNAWKLERIADEVEIVK